MSDTCAAAEPRKIASPLELLKALFEEPAPRCGAPATRKTPFGPMCEACWERTETGRKNRTNLLGIIEEAQQRRKQ